MNKRKKILVTGGCGYIGSHTLVDLAENGYDVVSIDNLSRGRSELLAGVSKILQKDIKNHLVDLCDHQKLRQVFLKEGDIEGVVHFAAFKSVPESVSKPLEYYRNNIYSLLNILDCCREFNVKHFVFSSSCSVYGNAKNLPVTEDTEVQEPESPYAATKAMGEQICRDFFKANPDISITLLRYFNPVGAHRSALIGEMNETPENLVPVITQTAIGKRPSMSVFGNDYPTRDGSCIRDYIHVSDIANAHTKALDKSIEAPKNEVALYNLGTGEGVSVLELISAFEQASGQKLNFKIDARRPGDVIAVYADRSRALQELDWIPAIDIDEMMRTAWEWEKNMNLLFPTNP